MRALITGTGNMGRAIRAGLEARGDEVVGFVGRPGANRAARPAQFLRAGRGLRVQPRIEPARQRRLRARGRRTQSRHRDHRMAVRRRDDQRDSRARSNVTTRTPSSRRPSASAPCCSPSSRSRPRDCSDPFRDYDPYVFEWHRRSKADRPSGTALAIAERLLPHLPSKRQARLASQAAPEPDTLEVVALRAGSSPGMHVVGFDAPGETIELRITARDRSAYVAGALFAADALIAGPLPCNGLIPFDELVRSRTKGTNR